jgi:two-component system cell cycle response regulator CtrA
MCMKEVPLRVLLMEDDLVLSRALRLILETVNFQVHSTHLGEEGIGLAKSCDYDLLLLDLNLPDMNGHAVLRTLRLAQISTPVLILSGAGDTDNKLKAFGLGADDYLTKPFQHEELLARINAVIRRSKGNLDSVIRTGKITINIGAKTVRANGKSIDLTVKEYQVLEILVLRKGRTITKQVFLNRLYDGLGEPAPRAIDVFICKLRKKLSQATGGEQYIETVRGRGYRFCDPSLAITGVAASQAGL